MPRPDADPRSDEGKARASYQNIENNLNILHGQPRVTYITYSIL